MTHSDFLPASRPVLWDARSCDEWLARTALADSQQACAALLALLDDLDDAPPRHLAYLQILERLREPLVMAQARNAKQFAARPLPLGHLESVAFDHACDLWMALLRACRRLLRAALKGGKPELAPAVPLLCERVIEYTGELVIAHFLARREVGEDLWHWLHEAYGLAEQRQVAHVVIPGAGSRAPSPSTCVAAYARPLLLALIHPYGLPEREIDWACRWTHRWAEKTHLDAGGEDVRGYWVDPLGASGPVWHDSDPASATIRHLDVTEVARSINWRLKKLEQGSTPAELGLGRDCARPATDALLRALLGSWTRPPGSRQYPRRAARSAAELACGMAQIHAALGGEVAAEEGHRWEYSRRDADQIHVFPREAASKAHGKHAAAVEQWETLDESAGGFRLLRRGPGARVVHRQLIALRPRGARQFILCEVRWLTQGEDRSLALGARALVGLAEPVTVRPSGEDAAKAGPVSPALVLPVARSLPASLVLPGGWYRSGRLLNVRRGGRTLRVRLTDLIAHGHDFDHVRFEFMA